MAVAAVINPMQFGREADKMAINSIGSSLYAETLRALGAERKSGGLRKGETVGKKTGEGDKVTISSRGNDLGRLVELSRSAPEVDSERVAELKSALEDGSLKVDSRELAARMFREMALESWFQ